ncbi:PAS domain S-box protein [Paucibacter sp. O1-1]|nr:PAS domain S-box protein [Paucibacter sp. O1-1]MDA3830010.1 PAS domain S-box protein [Paucibacter sp. O1-1]
MRRSDGSIFPADVIATLMPDGNLLGLVRDITERKRADLALRRSDNRFRAIFEMAGIGIALVDPDDGRILRCNRALADMLGYSTAELCDRRVHDVSYPDDDVVDRQLWGLMLSGETDRIQMERRYLRRDGGVVWVLLTATIVRDIAGDRPFVIGMMEDISARKRAELALRELNETLEQKVAVRTEELQIALQRAEGADRLKTAFLAAMSHELRTPLNSIIGFTGIMLNALAGPPTEEQTRQLGMVRSSARHLLELINDVLDLSKIEAGQLIVRFVPFDMRASLERVTESVRPLADRKGLQLTLVMDERLGEFTSDQRRVEQIVLNLLGNAIKFTRTGGITLTADCLVSLPSPLLRLRVIDTGIGISEADLAVLFQPFRQVDTGLSRQTEGTGLGLAISRRLAHLLHGEILAESVPGRGSAFTLTLPSRRQ